MKLKFLSITLITLFIGFTSCSEDDSAAAKDAIENKAPGDFTVTVTAEEVLKKFILASDRSAKAAIAVPAKQYQYIVTWTKSVDPDGDTVVYDVSMGDGILVTGSDKLTYTITAESAAEFSTKQKESVTVSAREVRFKDDNEGKTTVVIKEFDVAGNSLK